MASLSLESVDRSQTSYTVSGVFLESLARVRRWFAFESTVQLLKPLTFYLGWSRLHLCSSGVGPPQHHRGIYKTPKQG